MKILAILPVLFFSSTVMAQKKIEEKNLLWRISGNGAKENSYLFGTMHLKDNRLFNFKDSLYAALENCDRMALEFQPDSLAIALLQDFDFLKYMLGKEDEDSEADRSFTKYVEQKLTQKQIDSLQQAIKLLTGADKVDYKKLIAKKRLGYSGSESGNSMPVFMDAWLYNVARKQGKQISGLELMKTQLDGIDDMRKKDLPPDILFSQRGTQLFTEALISVYLTEDIQKLYDKLIAKESPYEQQLFINRNLQMLRSIESLISSNKLFIAVGAAHLAGDSGLVWLLRNQGYTVEPVNTSKRKMASQYQYKTVQLSGYAYKDTANGYGVRFPNEPATMVLMQSLKMHAYADIGTGMGYISFASVMPVELKNEDSAAIVQFLSDRLSTMGKFEQKKSIRYNGAFGLEFHLQSKTVEAYRARAFYFNKRIYLFILYAEDKQMLTQSDATDFFTSVYFETPSVGKSVAWEKYVDKAFAFTVMMPGKPQVTDINDQGSNEVAQAINLGIAVEMSGGNYYMFTTTKMAEGYYYATDSTLFNETQTGLCEKLFAKVTASTDTIIQAYQARKLDLAVNKKGGAGIASVIMLNRSGIVYVFIAFSENTKQKPASFDEYFNSITLIPYANEGWAYYQQDSLKIGGWLPGPFDKKTTPEAYTNEEVDTSIVTYVIYNKAAGHSFSITQSNLSPYFWALSDSSLWESLRRNIIKLGDSVLLEKNVANGHAKGKEWILLKEGGLAVTRQRLLFCGNKQFELITNVHKADVAEENIEKFFTEFKPSAPIDTAFVFTSKAARLLTDLRSSDSATAENAFMSLSDAPFSKEELPLLYDAIMLDYPTNDDRFETIAAKLARLIKGFKDDTAKLFAQRNYEKATKIKGLQYQLLGLILEEKTQAAAAMCKKLVLNNPPAHDGYNSILACMFDSAQLLQNWYPEILQLSNDAGFKKTLWRMTKYMLDSNLIQLSMILPYADLFYSQAKIELDSIKANPESEQYEMNSLFILLARCNTLKGNDLLKTSLPLLQNYVKRNAVVELARNNIRAAASEMLKLAQDDGWRYTFYTDLQQEKKVSWFPTKYATQQQMAKSYLYEIMEDEAASIAYIGERTVQYEGKQQRFYLFKISYGSANETEDLLGVCGPFSMDKTKLNSSFNVAEISETPYNKNRIEKDFKALLGFE